MIRIGRFRVLFERKGFNKAVKWWSLSVGYESKWLRAWKKKIRKVRNV